MLHWLNRRRPIRWGAGGPSREGSSAGRTVIPGQPRGTVKGQVALLLILAVAVGMILFGISYNFAKIAQPKSLTIKAANRASAMMASYIASYGERLVQESLGGTLSKCGWTKVFTLLVGGFILIGLIVTQQYEAIASLSSGLISAGTLFAAVTTALVFTVAAIILQVTVVQPGITKMWNSIFENSVTGMANQIMEQGINTALQSVVNDPAQIPDLHDIDQDGVFGPPSNPTNPESAPDMVSRFGYFLLQRIKGPPPPNVKPIQEFLDALEEFLFKGADGVGLFDPIDCTDQMGAHPCCPVDPVNDLNYPAMCDPCCQPLYVPSGSPDPHPGDPTDGIEDVNGDGIPDDLDGYGRPQPLRPLCCDVPASIGGNPNPEKCGDPTTCGARSAYPGYPWVYEDSYEDTRNDFISIHEAFGRDDEHPDFAVKRDSPNWYSDIPDAIQQHDVGSGFRQEDTTGFYTADPPVPFPPPLDERPGIFTELYRLKDWGVGMAKVTYAGQECFLCDPNEPTGLSCDASAPAWLPPTLNLPNPPGDYNGGWCVDNVNSDSWTPGEPPQMSDVVPKPDLFVEPDRCAVGPDFSEVAIGWKPGTDLYCSTQFPYMSFCPKSGPNPCRFTATGISAVGPPGLYDCDCGEPGAGAAELWHDDQIDRFIYEAPLILALADRLLNADIYHVAGSFTIWFDEMQQWIGLNTTPNGGVDEDYGILWEMRQALRTLEMRIHGWLSDPYVEAEGWCVPAANSCSPPEEIATFDSNDNGVRGDIEDVMACLDWNANDVDGVATGNSEKFFACDTEAECLANAAAICDHLPRSLLPDYCDTWKRWLPFVHENLIQEEALTKCWDTQMEYCDVLPETTDAGGQGDPAVIHAAERCSEKCREVDFVAGQDYYTYDGTTYVSWNFVPPTWKTVTQTSDSCTWTGDPDDTPPVNARKAAGVTVDNITWGTCDAYTGGWVFDEDATGPGFIDGLCASGEGPDGAGTWVEQGACSYEIHSPKTCQANYYKTTGGCPCSSASDIGTECFSGVSLGGHADCTATVHYSVFTCQDNGSGGVELVFSRDGDIDGCCNSTCGWASCGALGVNIETYSASWNGFDTQTCFVPHYQPTTECHCTDDTGNIPVQNIGNHCYRPGATFYPWNADNCDSANAMVRQHYIVDKCEEEGPAIGASCFCSWEEKWVDRLNSCQNDACGDDGFTFGDQDKVDEGKIDNVWGAYKISQGTCANTGPFNQFLEMTHESGMEAMNQVVKFRLRWTVLDWAKTSAEKVQSALKAAVDQLTAFLDNDTPEVDAPAEKLIDLRKDDVRIKNLSTSLDSVAVYVWQGPPVKEPRQNPNLGNPHEGYWHAVKVEGRVRERCFNACGAKGGADPTNWPAIKTWTKRLGTRRCYEIEHDRGRVKIRTIRFDEDVDRPAFRAFSQNLRFWSKTRMSHPASGWLGVGATVMAACEPFASEESAGWGWLHNAFMLNWDPHTLNNAAPDSPLATIDKQAYQSCWNLVHEKLLAHGVVTESCAEHYAGYTTGWGQTGFRVQFVPCDNGFLSGAY